MIDYHKELVSALNNVLPTHYELALTKDTTIPCISYQERNNYVDVNGDRIPNRTIKVNGKLFDVGDRFTVKVTEDGFIPGTEHELRAFLE